jgi:serine/threonine-protein kinase
VLPEVTGLPLADAQAALSELRLVPVEGTPAYSEDVPAGSVISWTVQDDAALVAGDEVLPDTAIVLVLSQGPQPRPAPDLTNMTLEEATAATAAVQLLVVEGEQLFSDTVEAGRTISQVPAVGEPVERGGTMTVQLSKGPDVVTFPDLTGQVYAQADAPFRVTAEYVRNFRVRNDRGPPGHSRRDLLISVSRSGALRPSAEMRPCP